MHDNELIPPSPPVLEEGMREIEECAMEKFGTLDRSDKTIAILGNKWWPQAAKQEGDKISEKFLCKIWKQRDGRPNVGGVSIIRSRNCAPSRKGYVLNGQLTETSNE